MLLERLSLKQLAGHRLRPVGLPLILGCFTIFPLGAWLMSRGHAELTQLPLAWLESLHHLWFLWVLLILLAAFLAAARVGVDFRSR